MIHKWLRRTVGVASGHYLRNILFRIRWRLLENLRASMPYFSSLSIGAETYDLTHLEPFTFLVNSTLAKRELRVHVTFSTHCFSKAYDPVGHISGTPIIDIHTPRPRSFCSIRYQLSHGLPKLIKSLEHPKARVWETAAQRNWCYSITIDPVRGKPRPSGRGRIARTV